jgi:hypothetical protein
MFPKSTLWSAIAVFSSLIIVLPSIAAQTSADRRDGGRLLSNSLTDIKTMLHASDEEWKVIGPKLSRVMAAYAVVETRINGSNAGGFMGQDGNSGFRGGMPGGGNDSFSGPGDSNTFGRGRPGFGGPGRGGMDGDFMGRGAGFGGPGMGGPPDINRSSNNAVMQKLAELQKTLADPKAKQEELKEKIAAVRNERKRARAELEAAQKDLRLLLTSDQEALLIGLGCLD